MSNNDYFEVTDKDQAFIDMMKQAGREVDVIITDNSKLMNCIPQLDGEIYYKPFDSYLLFEDIKQWRFSKENIYD